MTKVRSEGITAPHVTLAGTCWRYGPATLENEAETLAWWRYIVFSPVHNVQTGVPPENVVAMFEIAREYGVYHS